MYMTEDGMIKVEATFDNDTVWAKFAYTASDGNVYQVAYRNSLHPKNVHRKRRTKARLFLFLV